MSTGPADPPPPSLRAPCLSPSSSPGLPLGIVPGGVGVGQSPGAPSPLPICMFRNASADTWSFSPASVSLGAEPFACTRAHSPPAPLGALFPSGGVRVSFYSPYLPAPTGLSSLTGCRATLSDHRPDTSVFAARAVDSACVSAKNRP